MPFSSVRQTYHYAFLTENPKLVFVVELIPFPPTGIERVGHAYGYLVDNLTLDLTQHKISAEKSRTDR